MRRESIRNYLHSINNGPLQKPIAYGLLVFLVVGLLIYFFVQDNRNSDWVIYFRPMVQVLLEGKNIYSTSSYTEFVPYCRAFPIWALIPVIPFALLPGQIGYALLAISALFALGLVALNRGARPITLALSVFTPQAMFMAGNGNYMEALVALGLILPPQIGLFFVLIKPQIGAAVALFWLAEAWRDGGLRRAIRIFAPVTIAYALIFLLYWPEVFTSISECSTNFGAGLAHDTNIWPYGVVIGTALLIYAIRKRKLGPAILSSVCFAPYVGFYTWPIALLGLLPAQWEFAIAAVVMAILGFVT